MPRHADNSQIPDRTAVKTMLIPIGASAVVISYLVVIYSLVR